MADFQDSGTELDLEDITPLRGMVVESHELYEELIESGFTEKVAVQIIAHLLYDAVASRFMDEDDDEYDEEDDNDFDGDTSEPG